MNPTDHVFLKRNVVSVSLLDGYQVRIVPTTVEPRLSLSEDVKVSDEFRKDFDMFLLGLFGVKDTTPMKKGEVIYSETAGIMYMREDTARALRQAMLQQRREAESVVRSTS